MYFFIQFLHTLLVCAESKPVKCDNQILISFFYLEMWRNQNTAERKRPRFLIENVSNNELNSDTKMNNKT